MQNTLKQNYKKFSKCGLDCKKKSTQLIFSKPENSRSSLPEFPNQNLRQIGQGVPELCSNKQTDRDLYFTFIDWATYGSVLSFKDIWMVRVNKYIIDCLLV